MELIPALDSGLSAIGVIVSITLLLNVPGGMSPTVKWARPPRSRARLGSPANSAILMETSPAETKSDQSERKEANSDNEQSPATALDVGGLFLVSESESVAVLDTGATANHARFRGLEHHNRISQRRGYLPATTYPDSAQFGLGDGRVGRVRRAVGIPAGTAGSAGRLTTFAPHADIPALLRKGALEASGKQLDSSRGISTFF